MAEFTKKALTCLCFMCTCQPIFSQSVASREHGTLVLLLAEDDRLIVGADSRGTLTQKSVSIPWNTECKLMPLDNKMLFFATNTTRLLDSTNGRTLYDSHQAATKAFTHFQRERNTDLRTKRIANYWGNYISSKIRRVLVGKPSTFVASGQIVQGIFAGTTDTRRWSIYRIEIDETVQKEGKPTIVAPTVKPYVPPTDYVGVFGSDVSLTPEFLRGQTARAVHEQQRLADVLAANPGTDRDALKLEFAIAAVEKWAPDSAGIGGPIDILELRQGGGIHWIKVKDECKEQK